MGRKGEIGEDMKNCERMQKSGGWKALWESREDGSRTLGCRGLAELQQRARDCRTPLGAAGGKRTVG